MNDQIRLTPVRLIDAEGVQRGIVPTDEAMRLAGEAGLDLVEVSPSERPPVCKIMDYGKQKYLQSKKQKQKHHEQKLKEVRLRPKTDPHDKQIKMKRARSFLEQGDRVQFTMLFRGRERFHKELGVEAFEAIAASLEDVAKVERPARALGRRMIMTLVPLKVAGVKKPKSADKPKQSTVARPAAKPRTSQPPSQAAVPALDPPDAMAGSSTPASSETTSTPSEATSVEDGPG